MDTEKRSERKKMNALDIAIEAEQLVKRAAAPAEVGERICAQINRAARRLSMDPGQVKRLWYREWKQIPAEVFLHLRNEVERLERREALRKEQLNEIDGMVAGFRRTN